MKFESLQKDVLCTKSASNMLMVAAKGTSIETKIGPFWKNDGYDDKVPVPALISQ